MSADPPEPRASHDGVGQTSTRAVGPVWLPLPVTAVLLVATLVLWRSVLEAERVQTLRFVDAQARRAAAEVEAELRARVRALDRVARTRGRGNLDHDTWQVWAEQLVADYEGLEALYLVDRELRRRWRHPAASTEPETTTLEGDPMDGPALAQAARTGAHATTKLVAVTDGYVFHVVAPVREVDSPDAFVVGVFATRTLFGAVLHPGIVSGWGLAVFDHGAEAFARETPNDGHRKAWARSVPAALADRTLTVEVWPTPAVLAQLRTHLPVVVLGTGVAISLLCGVAAALARSALLRAAQAEAAREASMRTNAELERSNAELERFAYVASHDLQEPLRMVSSYTQLLSRRYGGRLGEEADEFIGYAVDGATRMQRLINDLLAFSRVATRGSAFSAVDVGTLLQRTVRDLGPALEEAQAELSFGELPVVSGDASQLGQLFQNLIANALKFRGAAPARVRIEAERDGGGWAFAVHDDGIGIAPEHFERIFVIFQRLHTREEVPGTGLGLALCKKIVERHGGRIWVESRPGAGSTFRFTLPAHDEAAA